VTMYQQINLYQPIFRKQRQIFSATTLAQVLGIVTVALLVPDLPGAEFSWILSATLVVTMLLRPFASSRGRLRSLGVFCLGVMGVLLVGSMVRWQADPVVADDKPDAAVLMGQGD